MNNVYLERIRRNLLIVSQYFDPERSSYSILKSCASSSTAEEMLLNLNKLGETKDFPDNFRNFFFEVDRMLNEIIRIDKEISDTLSKRDDKYREVKDEYAKRGMVYDDSSLTNEDYLNMSYIQKKEYLERLDKQLEFVDISLDEGIKKEKRLGEGYSDEINRMANVNNSNDKGQINSIERQAINNFKIVNNPDENFVFSIIEHFREEQREGSRLNIDIDYSNSSAVTLVVGYKGNVVNEKESAYKCVFSDMEYFNAFVRPMLISQHVIDGEVKSNLDNGELDSENNIGETMSVSGDTKEVMETSDELNYYVDSRSNVRKNKNVKVRKLELPNNMGNSNGVLFSVIMVGVLLLVVVILLIFVFR